MERKFFQINIYTFNPTLDDQYIYGKHHTAFMNIMDASISLGQHFVEGPNEHISKLLGLNEYDQDDKIHGISMDISTYVMEKFKALDFYFTIQGRWRDYQLERANDIDRSPWDWKEEYQKIVDIAKRLTDGASDDTQRVLKIVEHCRNITKGNKDVNIVEVPGLIEIREILEDPDLKYTWSCLGCTMAICIMMEAVGINCVPGIGINHMFNYVWSKEMQVWFIVDGMNVRMDKAYTFLKNPLYLAQSICQYFESMLDCVNLDAGSQFFTDVQLN